MIGAATPRYRRQSIVIGEPGSVGGRDTPNARETLRIATRSIRAHKLRSILTVVGVVIGIASVVTFYASFTGNNVATTNN